jgi:UDP-glucose/iron transport system permease protein
VIEPSLTAPAREFFALQTAVVDAAWERTVAAESSQAPGSVKVSVRQCVRAAKHPASLMNYQHTDPVTTTDALSLAAATASLVAVAVVVGGRARLGQGRSVVTATLRALVQLLAVGAVIGVILRTPTLAPLYLLVMVAAAAWTSGRRLRRAPLAVPTAAAALVAGAGISALIVFATRALPLDARTMVPFAAQLIGGSMTATTLAGQRLIDDVASSWDEVEGWLALGATSRQAVQELAPRAAARALVPALDQTRNVGLVVLPGAFVGLLLGGATPLQAGRVQLLVLIGLLAAETVAAVSVTRLLAGRIATTRPLT